MFKTPPIKLRRVTKQSLIRQCILFSSEDITIDSDNTNTSSDSSGYIQSSNSDDGQGSSQDGCNDDKSLDSSNGTSLDSSDDTSHESTDDDNQESTDDNIHDNINRSNDISSYCIDNCSRDSSDGSNSNSK